MEQSHFFIDDQTSDHLMDIDQYNDEHLTVVSKKKSALEEGMDFFLFICFFPQLY